MLIYEKLGNIMHKATTFAKLYEQNASLCKIMQNAAN